VASKPKMLPSASKVILRTNFFMFLLLYIHFGERKALRRDTGKQRQAIRNESEIQEICWRI